MSKFVQDDEVYPGQMLSKPALPPVAGLDLETVHEIDHVLEAARGTGSDAASRDGDGRMGLAGAADQDDVALLINYEAAAGEDIDQRSVDLRIVEPEVYEVLGKGPRRKITEARGDHQARHRARHTWLI